MYTYKAKCMCRLHFFWSLCKLAFIKNIQVRIDYFLKLHNTYKSVAARVAATHDGRWFLQSPIFDSRPEKNRDFWRKTHAEFVKFCDGLDQVWFCSFQCILKQRSTIKLSTSIAPYQTVCESIINLVCTKHAQHVWAKFDPDSDRISSKVWCCLKLCGRSLKRHLCILSSISYFVDTFNQLPFLSHIVPH